MSDRIKVEVRSATERARLHPFYDTRYLALASPADRWRQIAILDHSVILRGDPDGTILQASFVSRSELWRVDEDLITRVRDIVTAANGGEPGDLRLLPEIVRQEVVKLSGYGVYTSATRDCVLITFEHIATVRPVVDVGPAVRALLDAGNLVALFVDPLVANEPRPWIYDRPPT